MIQEAHIGVGISGREGMQAARAADFSIGSMLLGNVDIWSLSCFLSQFIYNIIFLHLRDLFWVDFLFPCLAVRYAYISPVLMYFLFQYRQSWTTKYKQDLYPVYYIVTDFIIQTTTWSLTWRHDQKHKDSIWFLWHFVYSKSSLHNVAIVLYRTTILLDAWFLFQPCLQIV